MLLHKVHKHIVILIIGLLVDHIEPYFSASNYQTLGVYIHSSQFFKASILKRAF
jgi:hypothetical protein